MIDQAQILRKIAMEKRGLDEFIVENENVPKIITIASGKGGVGKSNLATNLSICLTKLNKKVLILDADIGMSNIDIIMGVNVKGTIIDVINGEKNIEDIISQTKYGVNIISGGSALNHIEDFTEAQRNKFIHSIEQIHDVDFIIIDTGAGMSKSLLSFIYCSTEFFLITTPEPTSLTDVYSLLKAISNFGIKRSANIIINRVIDLEEAKSTYKRIKMVVDKFLNLNLELYGYIIDDKKVSLCVKKQIPFILEYPTSIASKCIIAIAKRMVSQSREDIVDNKSFLRKMFSIFKS